MIKASEQVMHSSNSTETKTQTLSYINDLYLHITAKPNSHHDADAAQENIKACSDMTGGKKVPMLVDLRQAGEVTKEARDIYCGPKNAEIVLKLAILASSQFEAKLAGILIGQSPFPIHFFSDEQKAKSWLLRNDSNQTLWQRLLSWFKPRPQVPIFDLDFFDSIISLSPFAIIYADTDRRVRLVNKTFSDLFGYNSDEVLGQTTRMLYENPEDFDMKTQSRFHKSADVNHAPYLMQYRKKNGKAFWGLTIGTPIHNRNGQISGFLGNIVDYSENHRLENELRTTRQRLQVALEASRIGVWEYDPQSGSLNWDAQMYELYGVNPLDFSGAYEAWQKGLHPEDLAQSESDLNKALQGMKKFDTEFRVCKPSGEISHIRAIANVEFDQNKKPMKMVGVNWDISSEKRASEMIKAALYKAKRASKAKSEFLSNMSHEIRTPMNGVLGTAELMLDDDLSPIQEKRLRTILSSGKAMLDILNDILDYSKIEAGKLKLDIHDFDIHEMLESISGLFSNTASEKGLTFKLQISPSCPQWIRSDSTRIRQIISNLVSNAIKFTLKGSVTLNIESVSASNTSQDTSEIDLVISIKDTGIGIPITHQSKIFSSFSQADTSTTREFGGSGLGLSISKNLAQLLKGDIEFESAPGQGSSFYLKIPAKKGQAIKLSPQKPPINTLQNQHLKVLLVEDNAINRDLAGSLLQKLHIQPDFANNGQEALDQVREKSYDLIFMDCQMPVLDGLEATKQIRSLPTDHQPIIVALTADAMVGTKDKCLKAGMNDYLTKPLSRQSISDCILNWQQKLQDKKAS